MQPVIEIGPPEDAAAVDAAGSRLGEYDGIVFSSANGVDRLLGPLLAKFGDVRAMGPAKIAAIGPATARRLAAYHLKCDRHPDEYRAEALAEALSPHVEGQRILWARASRGRDVLPQMLKEAGGEVEELVVYRNEDVAEFSPTVVQQIEAGELDWIGLSSPSIARGLKKLLPNTALTHLGNSVRLVSISPVTSAAAKKVGLPIAAEAKDYTWDGIFKAIIDAESRD